MARFSWTKAIAFLVAALVCFSEICCAATTAAPEKATSAQKTTAPPTTAAQTTSNMTTAASNMTTSASNMTTAASNMTTAASNMTTAASNMTTAGTNMTTTTSNMTTAPSNMTTAPSNMTTAPSNMTTAPSNMTTAPSNMTTAPSNKTTAPSNMTTTPNNMTTTQMVTTSSPEQRWKVKGKDGKLCMLMDFGGTITYQGSSHQIPASASVVKSKCESDAFSQFVLEFSEEQGYLWQLILNFTTAKSSFRLNEVTVTLYKDSSEKDNESSKKDFLDVPFGDYYKCNYLNISMSKFSVYMINPLYQPFVKKTEGGDPLGKEYHCSEGSSSVKIIIGVVIAIVVLVAAIGVTYYVVKRRGKPSDPPYARVQ